MTASELATIAEQCGWHMYSLQMLFGIPTDRLCGKSLEGVIQQAIDEGDDPSWVAGVLPRRDVHACVDFYIAAGDKIPDRAGCAAVFNVSGNTSDRSPE